MIWYGCCMRFVELHSVQVALCNFEIAHTQCANSLPKLDHNPNPNLNLSKLAQLVNCTAPQNVLNVDITSYK